MNTMSHTTEADAVVEVAQQAILPILADEGKAYAVTGPRTILDFEWLGDSPRRPRGQTQLHDAESFVAVVKEFKSSSTHIYADADNLRFVAIFNGHSGVNAGWGDFGAFLELRRTEEWSRWRDNNDVFMSQEVFAEFIEDGAPDIASPDAATMLEIAQTFQAKTDVEFRSSLVLASGERQLTYNESINAGAGGAGHITVPSVIELSIVPFEGGSPWIIKARFRYRLSGGTLKMGYKLVRPDELEREALNEATRAIGTATELAVLRGIPPQGVANVWR